LCPQRRLARARRSFSQAGPEWASGNDGVAPQSRTEGRPRTIRSKDEQATTAPLATAEERLAQFLLGKQAPTGYDGAVWKANWSHDQEGLMMHDKGKEPAAAAKKKVVRCERNCTYVGSGRDAPQCKNRCAQEVGHVLSCKCKTHAMQ
jgi:hypothetical protein